MSGIKIFGLTDVGMEREKNEDSFCIFKTSDMEVAVVADGMGGHTGGQIASSTTVKTIKNYFQKNGKKLKIKELIEDSLTLSNRKIREMAASLPSGMSMGTTCTMAVIKGKFCYYGHIGDSKLYHITKDSITQISTDHTMLQRMLDSGALKAEEAENYAHKNIIYRSIGGSENFKTDSTKHFLFMNGEMLLLCSDGLSGYITREQMFEILKQRQILKVLQNI
ncbi:MAG: protein phosphatase 2C domain-containing protein [Acidobacteriota bacterium]|nr:protein phosphatase 2C domain-containing protein [Acidobacteriota bacterium]